LQLTTEHFLQAQNEMKRTPTVSYLRCRCKRNAAKLFTPPKFTKYFSLYFVKYLLCGKMSQKIYKS